MNGEELRQRIAKECNLSNREISSQLKRSSTVIDNFVEHCQNYNLKRVNRSFLNINQAWLTLKVASNFVFYECDIVKRSGLKSDSRDKQKLLKYASSLIQIKQLGKPLLNESNTNARLNFTRNKMNWGK